MKQRRRIYYSAAQRSDAGEAEAESAQTLIGDSCHVIRWNDPSPISTCGC
jgi:hypothetical protein